MVQVGLDEPCVAEADLGRYRSRELHRREAEIGAGHLRPETSPRQRVDPEMALEMEQLEPVDRPYFVDLVGLQPDAAALEPLEVVEGRGLVDPRPLVPQLVIGADRLMRIYLRFVAHSAQAKSTSADPSDARANRTISPASSRIQGFSSPGNSPRSSSTRSIQRPATASTSRSAMRATAPSHERSIRSTDRPVICAPSSSCRASMKSVGSLPPVTVRTASANRSSQVGSRPPPSDRS